MWEVIQRNPRAAAIAASMHALIILFMVVGVDWLKPPQAVAPEVAVVQATVIDQSELDAEVAKLKQADEKEKAEAEAARKQEEQKLAEIKRQQIEEKQRLEELEQKREQEERKKVEGERQRKLDEKKRIEEEKKRLEDEKKRKVEEQKRTEEEQKRKAEEEKKLKAEEEKKRKAEEEKKRKAEEEKKRKEAEAKRKADEEAKRKAEQKAREDALLAAAEAERSDREMGRYVALIKNKIQRNWLRPANTDGLKCTVRVRLIPGGDVVPGSVMIVKSSGNAAFDRSVEQAVYRAAPLDVPSGALFERFRDVVFEFDPSRN